ncbi:MAG: hypothetical protein P9L88_05400 [Candidatus Tantalella remota]|nr:hypothetical protein [Candidatus Tantalella remota]
MKVINTKGIIIFVAILLVFQFAVGMVISPLVGKAIVTALNKTVDTKITVGSVNVWPLTLGVSMKDLKVFDPDNQDQRMVGVKKASMRISLWGLLCKRLTISSIGLYGADITLRGEPDGSFNIQKIVKPSEAEGAAAKKGSVFDRFKKGQDWFSRIYDMVKNRSEKDKEEEAEDKKAPKPAIQTKVIELPRGRRVLFEATKGGYLFEIRSLVVKDARIKLEAQGGRSITIEKANISLKGLGVDPVKGARINAIGVKGRLVSEDNPAGDFSLSYTYSENRGSDNVDIDLSARKVDLAAMSFIYEDSLPVDVKKGLLTIRSRTSIRGEDLNSKNALTLTGQELAPGSGGVSPFSIVPMPMLCNAMNQVDPLKLDFTITGTLDDPQFGGFQDSLMNIIKPYIGNIAEQQGKKLMDGFLKKETGTSGAAAAEDENTANQTVDAIKSLFKKDE